MTVVEEFLKKEKKIEEVKKAHPLYQETYLDKHPWQAAALSLGEDVVNAARNNLAELNRINEASKQTLANKPFVKTPTGIVANPQTLPQVPQRVNPQPKVIAPQRPQQTYTPAPAVPYGDPTAFMKAMGPGLKNINPVLNSAPKAVQTLGQGYMTGFGNLVGGVGDVMSLVGDIPVNAEKWLNEKTGIAKLNEQADKNAGIAYNPNNHLTFSQPGRALSAFGKNIKKFADKKNEFWKPEDKYADMESLLKADTALPTVAQAVGSQIPNVLAMLTGAGMASKAGSTVNQARTIGALSGLVPSILQEGPYLEKIEAFEKINGRKPTTDELFKIMAASGGEKVINSALEYIPDKMLMGKILPNGKSNLLKDIATQALSEGLTEAAQEAVSVGSEKLSNTLYPNQNIKRRIANSGVMGAIPGAVFGGAGSIAGNVQDQNIEQIAPNIVAKQEAQKQTVKENLTVENPVADNTFTSYKDAFLEMKQRGKGYTIVQNPDKTYSVKERTNIAKKVKEKVPEQTKVEKKIEEIAPNIAEKQGEQVKANIQKRIEYRAKDIKNKFSKIKDVDKLNNLIDDIVKNPEKYSDEAVREKTHKEFRSLLPNNRKVFDNDMILHNLLWEARKMSDIEGIVKANPNPTQYFKDAERLNKNRGEMGNGYWTKDTELGARAFASYILEKMNTQSIKNSFLERGDVDYIDWNALGKAAAGEEVDSITIPSYPKVPEERERIFKAFDDLFNTIKTRETEKGVELYYPDKDIELPSFIEDVNKAFFMRGKDVVYDGRKVSTLGEIRKHKDYEAVKDFFDKNDDNVEIRLLEPDYTDKIAYYRKGENCLYVRADVTPELIIHEYTHYLDYKYNGSNFIYEVEHLLYNVEGKGIEELRDNFFEGIAIENWEIAKRRLNGDKNAKFRRPTNIFKTVIEKIAKGEYSGRSLIRDYRLFQRIKKTPGSRTEQNKGNVVQFTNSTQQKAIKQANEKAKDYVRQWYANIEKDRYDVNKSLTSFINITKQKAKDFSKAGLKVSDKQIREIMPFLRERTEFPDKLDRPDLKKVWEGLSKSQKAELTRLADAVSEKFDKYYKNYQDANGVVTENDIENHISHIWDLDNKKKSLLTNYFVTKSKFAKERTIDTLYKGIQGFDTGNGEITYFTPKTLDYAEILKTSSDNLIKATHDMQLANIVKDLKYGKTRLVQPMSKAPADWVEVNHPAINKAIYMGTVGEDEIPMIMKMPVKVHPEIANALNTVFETPATSNDFLTGYDKLNSIFKQSQLGFSGFHMVALSESMLGNMGIKDTVKILSPKRIWDEVAKGNWSIYKEDTIAKQAIEDGLQFGATLDLDRKGVEQIADDVSNWVEKRIPIIGKGLSVVPKILSKAQKLNNTILWDYLHNNYKFECYKILCQQAAKNGPLSTKERQEIAQWVNDSFGGQVWENLGIKPSGRRTEQRILLSPDWLRSTTRQFMGMISNKGLAEKLSNKAAESEFWKKAKDLGERWGINSNTDDVTASTLRGKIARKFWLRSLIYSAILYNALNAVMRGFDRKKHPELYPEKMTAKDYTLLGNSQGNKTYVFVGRNKDGSERYLRLGKQFREVPEMAENPLKKLGGKASPNIQLISQLATGHTASGFQNKELYVDKYPYNQMKTGTKRILASGKVIAKSFMPYSLNTLFNPDADWTPLSLFAPVSKGMTKGKGRIAYEKDFYNDDAAAKITKAMLRNNISKEEIERTYKQARTNTRSNYRNMYVEAIESGDEQKVIAVTKKLKKKGLSNDEIEYIYGKALEKIEE